MERKRTVADGNVDEAMVKIYCLTCGKLSGGPLPAIFPVRTVRSAGMSTGLICGRADPS